MAIDMCCCCCTYKKRRPTVHRGQISLLRPIIHVSTDDTAALTVNSMADLGVEKSSEESLNSTSILERLQQYGESWFDDDEYQKFIRKKLPRSKTSQQSSHHRYAGEQNGATETEKVFSRRQKKKLKQKVNAISEGSAAENSDDILEKKFPVKRKRKNKHLEELQSELELNRNLSKTKEIRKDVTMNQRLSHADVIKPVGSDGKIFVFEDPAKRKQKKKLVISPVLEEPSSLTPEVPAQPEVNLHQARHDVKMFGITGFQGQQKETAVTDMLIKLGAKPPKRSFCSIKEFMETKQKIGTPAMNQKGGVKNLKGNKRRRKRKDGIGFLDGQIGSYRSGVQILKRDDIQRVKKYKVKK